MQPFFPQNWSKRLRTSRVIPGPRSHGVHFLILPSSSSSSLHRDHRIFLRVFHLFPPNWQLRLRRPIQTICIRSLRFYFQAALFKKNKKTNLNQHRRQVPAHTQLSSPNGFVKDIRAVKQKTTSFVILYINEDKLNFLIRLPKKREM